jgi:hypothetical protein
MYEFFQEGGWSMYPILIVGIILLVSSTRYAIDREPVRIRFITALSLALVALLCQGMLLDAATVLWAVAGDKFPPEMRSQVLMQGMKESTRPGIMGLALLSVSLVLVSIGSYRVGSRELQAARG